MSTTSEYLMQTAPQKSQEQEPQEPQQTAPQKSQEQQASSVPSAKDVMNAVHNDESIRNLEQAQLKQTTNAEKRPSYVDMIRQLYPEVSDDRKWQTEEQRIARRKKRDAIMHGLGDSISALANLAATKHYATPMTLSSLSEAGQQRFDKIKAERDAKKEAYRAAYLRAAQADAEADAAARKEQQSLLLAAQKRADEERKWQAELLYKMGRAQAEDKYHADKLAQDYELGNGRIAASKYNTKYRTDHKSSGSSGAKKNYPYTDKDENTLNATTPAERDYYARANGTYVEGETEETTSRHIDEKGNVTETTTTRHKKGYARPPKKNTLKKISNGNGNIGKVRI